MGWWMAIPAVLTAANALYTSKQQKDAAAAQQKWNIYNSHTQYSVSLNNIKSQAALAQFNAAMAKRAGGIQSEALTKTARLNADIIEETSTYNDSLLEEEVALLWEKTGLDVKLLQQQRARERGGLIAAQSASGTVIGEGSNADVIIAQKAQEQLELFVIQHGADIQATKIANARAQGEWQADMAIEKVLWEGQMGSYVAKANADLQSLGILGEAAISGSAALTTAGYQLEAGIHGSQMDFNAGNQTANNTLTTGLFSAASQGVQAYYTSQNSSLVT